MSCTERKAATTLATIVSVGFLLTGCVSPSNAAAVVTGMRGKVTIAFNDRTVLRRAEADAPLMGSGLEDFGVRIACLDLGDCKARVPNLTKALAQRHEANAPCRQSYARITFESDDFGQGRVLDKYDVDFTGVCLTYNGHFYTLQTSVFEILNRRIADW